jgi:hypothetical protein
MDEFQVVAHPAVGSGTGEFDLRAMVMRKCAGLAVRAVTIRFPAATPLRSITADYVYDGSGARNSRTRLAEVFWDNRVFSQV